MYNVVIYRLLINNKVFVLFEIGNDWKKINWFLFIESMKLIVWSIFFYF